MHKSRLFDILEKCAIQRAWLSWSAKPPSKQAIEDKLTLSCCRVAVTFPDHKSPTENVTLKSPRRPLGHCWTAESKGVLKEREDWAWEVFSNPDCFTMASGADAVDWNSIKSLVFGGGVKQTVLDRWLQPFTFSSQVSQENISWLGQSKELLGWRWTMFTEHEPYRSQLH